MRRLLLALMLLASPAWGATYWVAPGPTMGGPGRDTNSGADSTTNAKTLGWVNANAAAGSIIRFKSGQYETGISPIKNGTSGSRIRFYGFPQDPTAVQVAGIDMGTNAYYSPPHYNESSSYTTVRWFTSTRQSTGLSESGCVCGTDDSLVACNFPAQNSTFYISSARSVVDSITMTGVFTGPGQQHAVYISGERDHGNGACGEWCLGSIGNSLKHSTFNLTVNSPSDFHGLFVAAALNNTVSDCTFNIVCNQAGGYFFPIESYEGYGTQLLRNTFNVTMNTTPGGTHSLFALRDSTSNNLFQDNMFNVTGTGQLSLGILTNAGTFNQSEHDNTFNGNTFIIPNPGGIAVNWKDGMMQDIFEFNTVITTSTWPALGAIGFSSNYPNTGSIIRHNTLYTNGPTVVDFSSGSSAGYTPNVLNCGNISFNAGNVLSSNIYYAGSASSAGNETVKLATGGSWTIDSTGVFYSAGGLASRALAISGTATPLSGAAVFADPQFVSAPSNLHLLASSPAINASYWDGYAGAYGTTIAATYTISTDYTAGHGLIFPSSPLVSSGGSQSFIFVPSTGYAISDVKIDGVSVGTVNTYTFSNVTAAHTVRVAFALRTFTVYAAAGTGGTLSPSGTLTYSYGDQVTFALTANSGKKVSSLYVNDAPVTLTAQNTYTATITAPLTVQAFFTPDKTSDPTPTTYTITATAGAGGYITHAGQNSLAVDDTLTFAVVPYTGYHATAFTLDGISQLPNDTVTPTIIDDNRTVSVTFAPDSVAAILECGDNGSVSKRGVTTLINGGSFSCLIVPNPGFGIASVTQTRLDASGVFVTTDLGHPDGVTLSGLSDTRSIYATFAPLSQIPRGGGVPRRWR